MPERCHFNLRYTVAGPGLRAAVTDLLRYVDRREWDPAGAGLEPAGLGTYLPGGSRPRARGPLFDAYGPAGEPARRHLTSFVVRSVEDAAPLLRRGPDGIVRDYRRAYYHAIVSPELASGLDLRRLARELMTELQEDAGSLPAWLGAEHRDTAHPHVHLLLPARRETSPGRFQALMISPRRLRLMRGALEREIERQRGNPRPWALELAQGVQGTGDRLRWGPHLLMTASELGRLAGRHRQEGEAERARREERETDVWER